MAVVICRICGQDNARPAFGVCVPCEPVRLEQARSRRALRKAWRLDADERADQQRRATERQMRKQRQVYQ